MQLRHARTRIHGGYQHETRWESECHRGAGDAQRAILERLAEHFENVTRKFGKFIEKQHSVVGQAGFAGPRHTGPSANQPGIGDGVVR